MFYKCTPHRARRSVCRLLTCFRRSRSEFFRKSREPGGEGGECGGAQSLGFSQNNFHRRQTAAAAHAAAAPSRRLQCIMTRRCFPQRVPSVRISHKTDADGFSPFFLYFIFFPDRGGKKKRKKEKKKSIGKGPFRGSVYARAETSYCCYFNGNFVRVQEQILKNKTKTKTKTKIKKNLPLKMAAIKN